MRGSLRWSDLDIETELGSGQAGVVVRARLRRPLGNLNKGEVVAVKRYKSWLLEQPGQFERIFRELETGRAVNHPYLVKTIGVVADDLGRPALVMKYYHGETLQAFLERHRADSAPVDANQTLTILRCLAGALNALHSAGIIHRDVKPANVILTVGGAVLMDLGVVTSHAFAQETTTAGFLGTIRYAAQEYLFGEVYDKRADVFSFGAIVYELLMNEQFDGEYEHWANLVAKRRIDYSFSWNADQRYQLTERLGLNVLEFLVSVLDCSLTHVEARNLNLGTLATTLEGLNLNHDHCHFDHGKCVLDPPFFRPLGGFSNSLPSVTLEQIGQDLRHRLTDYQRLRLLELLGEYYWEPNWIKADKSDLEPLMRAGVLNMSWVRDFARAEWHDAVKYMRIRSRKADEQ
jgi:serine/threonine protein kinase